MYKWYLYGIQNDLKTIRNAAERAAEQIEHDPAYNNSTAPYHNSAVATYNRLTSILIEIDNLIIDD